MRIDYTDRLKEMKLTPGVNAKWFEGYTLQEVIDMITGGVDVEPDHIHGNFNVIELFGVTEDGKLTFNGKEIVTSGTGNGGPDDTTYILATQVIETIDRKFVSSTEKNYLSGLKSNIQGQLDILSLVSQKAMKFVGRYNTYKDMTNDNKNPSIGDTAFIDNDETQNSASTIYYYKDNNWLRIKKDKSSNGWIASTSAPADKTVLWLDISNMPPVIKWYSGNGWIDISSAEVKASDVIQEPNLKFVTDAMISILSDMRVESGDLLFQDKILGGVGGSLIDDSTPEYSKTYSSKHIQDNLDSKQPRLGYVAEDISKKGIAGGYAPLNANRVIPMEFLDDLAKQYNFVKEIESEKDAITNMLVGDTCYVIGTEKDYIYLGSTLGWMLKNDIYKLNRIPTNKLDGTRSPNSLDDAASGYTEGSIWINRTEGHPYICVDSTEKSAVWDLMGGQISVATGEIIPFHYDANSIDRVDGQTKFDIPFYDLRSGYLEIALDGKEQTVDKDYVILRENGGNCIEFTNPIAIDQVIVGEVYLVGNVGDQAEIMRKMQYDTNNDGVVDRAEVADTFSNFREWEANQSYHKDAVIIKDGVLLRAKESFMTGTIFDNANWNKVYAKPSDLEEFTTDNLIESETKKYASPEQLASIDKIPSIVSLTEKHSADIALNRQDINKNAKNIADLTINTTSISNKLNDLKLVQLKDTPNNYSPDAYMQVNKAGTGFVYNNNPMFPIKEIIDGDNTSHKQIEKLKFNKFSTVNFDTTTRVLELTPNMKASDLLDFPEEHNHGKILISNGYNSKYELIDTSELTVSKENFNIVIAQNDWQQDASRFYCDVVHPLDSTHLIFSFVDENKDSIQDITYRILDNSTVRLFSSTERYVSCTMNSSLGVKNGYWEFMFDLSKLEYVDDTKVRLDKGYSSSKITNLLNLYAKADNVYSKTISDTKFALKTFEHGHLNLSCLDKITEDESGNIYFDGKKLIHEIIPYTYSDIKSVNAVSEELVFDVQAIYAENKLQCIVNSELLISTQDLETEARIKVYDDRFKILDEIIVANDIQKYILGISNKIKVYVTGQADLKITVASI